MFLDYSWKLMLGTVNNKIYKIALYADLKTKKEANPIAMDTLLYCTKELGEPSIKKTGLFMWDAFDGNVILQTAEVGNELSINLFLTSSSVNNFEHK